MNTTGLQHRHGGEITAVKAIGHETYKGVASWHFVCDVTWLDGSKSIDAHIDPGTLCFEPDNEQGRRLMDSLAAYLERAGTWHDPKNKRGRMYCWTPHEKDGREVIE